MNCPICKDSMLYPRIYPQCGHTICEPCMMKNDNAEKDKITSAFTVPIFSCPICRQTSLLGWYQRPINRLILTELRKDDAYEQLYKDYKEKRGDFSETEIPEDVDLATIAKRNRKEKTENLYKELLPILFTAAADGKPFITIYDKKKIHDIQLTADLLSKKLFDKNKIYKLLITRNECEIEIIPSNRNYKSEYVNLHVRRLGVNLRHSRSLGSELVSSLGNILEGNPHV